MGPRPGSGAVPLQFRCCNCNGVLCITIRGLLSVHEAVVSCWKEFEKNYNSTCCSSSYHSLKLKPDSGRFWGMSTTLSTLSSTVRDGSGMWW